MSVRTSRRSAGLIAVFVVAVTAVSASAVDRVIFKDGFVIEGTMFKEKDNINDPVNGTSVQVPKIKGFDVIDDGLRWWIYSTHQARVGEIQKNVQGLPDLKEYTRETKPIGPSQALPGFGKFNAPDFDKDWARTIRISLPGGTFQDIKQVIAALGPQRMIVYSRTHRWNPYFSTRELGPETIRRLLTTHPDLDEKGKPDPMKRIAIATFFYQGDYLDAARAEIAKAKKDIPGAWTKEQTEALDKLEAVLSAAEAKYVTNELEVAKAAGRYADGQALMAMFKEKAATGDLTKRFSTLKAEFDTVQPNYQATRRLLDRTLAVLSKGKPAAGAAAGGVGACAALQQLPDQAQKLVLAGEAVLAELHPDNFDRIDVFRKLAQDAEKQNKSLAGKEGEALLALAVSAWAMGQNGAENDVVKALRLWEWRETLIAYQNEDILNKRRALFAAAQKAGATVTPDVLAQVIRYLPPPKPEDLTARTGKLLPPNGTTAPGIYRRNTGQIKEAAGGVDYLLRLPAEYHHGRAYPVLLVLSATTAPPEQLLSLLSYEADRNGFILAAPVWTNQFGDPYDWTGDQHYKVQAVRRDLFRHFNVDVDRVSLFGFAEGANFAMDAGASHPDLFAAVLAMGPNPRYLDGPFKYYWRNCQKLPVYVAAGAMAGAGLANVRSVYENWMFHGYPSIATVYRGRGMEWFSGEVAPMLDWVRLKKRATGTAVLRLNSAAPVEPWQMMRAGDNRFYWIGSDNIKPNNLQNGRLSGFVPAALKADIIQGNRIVVTEALGLKTITFWLDREMIDWSKPVSVLVNAAVPRGYKPAVLKQDLEFMMENFREEGDKSLLFLNKLEVTP